MRRDAKVDANQAEIVRALRKLGASIQHLHMVGRGCPDILVGYGGVNLLMEIKAGETRRAVLTPEEHHWHLSWQGQVAIVRSVEEAVKHLENVGGAWSLLVGALV